jgi:hypothetical protein
VKRLAGLLWRFWKGTEEFRKWIRTMESLYKRVSELEATLDVHDSDTTVSQALQLLRNQLQALIGQNAELNKLFKNLNNSSVKFHLDHSVVLDGDQLELEREIVYSQFDQLVDTVEYLTKVQNTMTDSTMDINVAVLSEKDQILRHYRQLQYLELRYNGLLIRSIALLQNLLNVHHNKNLES